MSYKQGFLLCSVAFILIMLAIVKYLPEPPYDFKKTNNSTEAVDHNKEIEKLIGLAPKEVVQPKIIYQPKAQTYAVCRIPLECNDPTYNIDLHQYIYAMQKGGFNDPIYTPRSLNKYHVKLSCSSPNGLPVIYSETINQSDKDLIKSFTFFQTNDDFSCSKVTSGRLEKLNNKFNGKEEVLYDDN